MDPTQKSETLKRTPKIKNYNVIFHTHPAINEFTTKLLKKFPNYILLQKKQKPFHKSIFFSTKL